MAITQDEYDNAFKWENQALQYPSDGRGIECFKGIVNEDQWVDCLLYYGDDNKLEGIFNLYAFDFPPYEKKGKFNIQVRKDKRKSGIATALLNEALLRFDINLEYQDYTPLGKKFINKYLINHNSK